MNQDRINAMQEAYDNQEAPFDEGLQTQEEINKEVAQEIIYNSLIDDARNMEWEATESFIYFMNVINNGEAEEETGELLMFMLSKAANYNGSEAEVPDFVRLVRMAFEWKSKQ